MTMDFSPRQFRDGDLVLHCGHLERRMHAFSPPEGEPFEFTRPDGSKGLAAGVIQCDDCVEAIEDRPSINGELIWKGNGREFRQVPLDDLPKSIRGW